MGKFSKFFALLLALIVVISCLTLLMVKPANAQLLPKPSAPEFTVQYIVYTSYIAPTYTINPYNGQNQTASGGYTQENQTIEFTIKNQPFTPYTDSDGNYIGLYYNFRYKGHYGDQWNYYPFYLFNNSVTNQSQIQTTHSYGPYSGGPFVYYSASSSEYTVISITLNALTIGGYEGIPDGSLVDFQTQAQIGHIADIPSGLLAGDFYNFTGESSDWSNTQTININYNSNSTATATASNPTIAPTQSSTTITTPAVQELSWSVILPLLLSMFSAALILKHRKTINLKQ